VGVEQTWEISTEAGFMACYRATFREVYAYAGMLGGRDRASVEDVVQDVYTAALRRARDGELKSVSIGYFIIATRRRSIDAWRSSDREKRRLQLVTGGLAADTDDQAGQPSTSLPAPMLDVLSERERAAVILRFVDDLTVAQVATELGVSTRAAESTLSRALARLRRGDVRHA
jgi:RNA polymerase sigma factor (sigma-70 family)